jgi:uncharacterized membrane protein
MKNLVSLLLGAAPRCVTIASCASLVTANVADARVLPSRAVFTYRGAIYDRVAGPASRPAHIPVSMLRTDPTGDTPQSSKYYKLTNISAEVGSAGGFADAVNNDGRILYMDLSEPNQVTYIVNNGGTSGALAYPLKTGSGVFTIEDGYALNENGEAVGLWGYAKNGNDFSANVAWSLSGSTDSGIVYFGSRAGSYTDAVNNKEVAVGYDGLHGTAVAYEGSSNPPGHTIDLKGLKGESCGSVATAINDAGEIVGSTCNEAVRFSLAGYAEALSVAPKGTMSSAEAINEKGDVVGFAGDYAFLYHLGKTIDLPLPKGDAGPAVAYSVNASDEVVGDLDPKYSGGAFLYTGGRAYDLNSLIAPHSGWQIADAFGINDHGEIVGDGYYNGRLYGISLKPPA